MHVANGSSVILGEIMSKMSLLRRQRRSTRTFKMESEKIILHLHHSPSLPLFPSLPLSWYTHISFTSSISLAVLT